MLICDKHLGTNNVGVDNMMIDPSHDIFDDNLANAADKVYEAFNNYECDKSWQWKAEIVSISRIFFCKDNDKTG